MFKSLTIQGLQYARTLFERAGKQQYVKTEDDNRKQ